MRLTRYELLARLVNEGFIAQQFSVLSIGQANHDGLVLEEDTEQLAIYHYQNGRRGEALYASVSEQDVCERYYALVSQAPAILLMVDEKSAARHIQALLSSMRIESELRKMPIGKPGAQKYQVIVAGRDLGAARHALLLSTQHAPKKWWRFWS